MKSKLLLVAKIGGLVCTIAGTILNAWANSKENERILEKLVNDKLQG